MHVRNYRKNCGVEFFQSWISFFWSKQNLAHRIFSCFFFCVELKQIMWGRWGHSLSFKIDANDGKKWGKFVAM